MNCYGTNPRYTQPVQPVKTMNTMNSGRTGYNYTNATATGFNPQNPYNTTTSGEWSQPIPTNPNMPTSPASYPAGVMPSISVQQPSPQPIQPPTTLPAPLPDYDNLPPTLTETIYTPGYLRLHIGDLMRVEFLIGNQTTDRVGRLKQVGASFIVLSALDGGSEIVCDIYSIKFVTIIQNTTDAQLYANFSR